MGLKEVLDATAAGALPAEAAEAALARGEALIAAGDLDGAATALRQAAMSPATQLRAYNLVETHGLLGAFGPWMGLDCHIDPQDDVFGFFNGYGTWSSPMRDYLADGWRTLSELMLLLERSGCPLTGFANVLEFANGHGRFTRHLVKAIGAERLTVSDVVPGAVTFTTQQFGVRGFCSTTHPAELEWPHRHDLIFVLSLFSHLPRGTWQAWLSRLWAMTAPGGVLVFTTHGAEAARRAGVTLAQDGYFFHAESESKAIDAQEYGVTYTLPAYVQAQIAALPDAPVRVDHTPTWFWSHQDAFVLHKAG